MLKLVIGNKNYSSWSLRPWLVLRHFEIPFEEVLLSFNDPEFSAKARTFAPTGQVPVLVAPTYTVWDSLAIVETLAQDYPDRAIWPSSREARARARSICAQMHAGFADLRRTYPMNVGAMIPGIVASPKVQDEIATITALWAAARRDFGGDGPYLFGAFSAADAYFAPIVMRMRTYGLARDNDSAAYVATILEHREVKKWLAEAKAEFEWVAQDEPYRTAP